MICDALSGLQIDFSDNLLTGKFGACQLERKLKDYKWSGFLTQLLNRNVAGTAATITKLNLTNGGKASPRTKNWNSNTNRTWKI
jgi:hypothetical protein